MTNICICAVTNNEHHEMLTRLPIIKFLIRIIGFHYAQGLLLFYLPHVESTTS